MLFCSFVVLFTYFSFTVSSKESYYKENVYSTFDEMLNSSNPEQQEVVRVTGKPKPETSSEESLEEYDHHQIGKVFLCEEPMFQKFTAAKYINFANTHILSLSTDCFSGMNALMRIDLRRNHLTAIDIKTFRTSDEMKVHTLFLGKNFLTQIEFSDYTLPDLVNFDLSSNRIRTVRFTTKNLPEILALDMQNNHIFQFNIESETLMRLNFDGNRIISFEGSSLDTPELTSISLKDNQLITVTADMFVSSPKLMEIGLARNLMDSIDLRDLKDLEKVNLISSSIRTLSDVKLPESNRIHLTLDFNKILYLESRGTMRNAEYFSCIFCNIRIIDSFFIADIFKNIQDLRLTNNFITTTNIFDASEDLELRKINLMYNKIRKIGANDFIRLTKVVYLNLMYNDISTVSEGAFNRMTNLSELNLSNNLIFQLPRNAFESTRLKFLSLDHNNMPFFRIPGWQEETGQILSSNSPLNKLIILSFTNNPLQCQCLDLIRKWTKDSKIYLFIEEMSTRMGIKPSCIVNDRGCRTDVGKEFVKDYWHYFNDKKVVDIFLEEEYE
ncbi:protein artichoke-like [Phlebotomus argentipes]|uniref:protein artichoke-like n=1 Tax=Phlebotomus argentipes TaxID=94469 RepID=UPI0028929AC2|nr:protein artichoke-like [Phlebotomus argentipes]